MQTSEPVLKVANPPLLDALLSLKPNVIYTMGGPKEISAAAAAFSAGAVESFRWGESGRLLEVRMSGAGRPAVLFTWEDGRLQTSAQPEAAHTNRNILPAIMTIARVLVGARFHRVDLPSKSLEKFRRELRAPVPEAVRPRVILARGATGERFDWDFDSGVREASWRVAGPPLGMEWLGWQEREPERVGEGFCRWLAAKSDSVDLEVRGRGGAQILADARAATLRGRTQLETSEGQVIIRRAILDESGTPLAPFFDIGYGLVYLPDQSLFAQVQPPGAWNGFARLDAIRPGDQSLHLPAGSFFMPCPPDAGTWVLLDGEGLPVEPVGTGCRGLLDAATDGPRVRLRLRVLAEAGREMPAHQHFARSLESLFLDGPFALLVQSARRRRRLAERLAEAPEDARDLELHLVESADDSAFTSRAMHGEDAEKCLRHLLGQLRRLDHRHLAADPDGPNLPGFPDDAKAATPPGNPWLACAGAGTALGRGLSAFVRAFPGEDLLRAKDLVFELDGMRFFEGLPALVAACEELGVNLRVDEKATRIESLSLSVRILRGGEIDWFELHPEVCAGALTIPRSQWEQVLRSGHYRDESETLVAFDAASLSRLRRMAGLMGDGVPHVPRLRLFDWIALRNEGISCGLPNEDEAVLGSLLNLETLPRHTLPAGLRADLREYQHHGYDWLCFLYRHRFGACLADDMGLGKTLQAIALLAALQDGTLARQSSGPARPHLIVLPSTLLFNWQSEIRRFAPALKVHEYTGQERSADFSGADIVMTTYGLVHRDIEALAKVRFDVAIFDEAQAVKNATAARTRAAGQLQADFRLCLTGTPLENHIGEFHSIMEAAVPGLFGDRKAFLRDHESGLPVLARVRPFLLRRTKEKILAELPAKVESDAYFSLSDSQRECYTRAVGEVRQEVLAAYEDRPSQQAGIVALAALLRLRQICIAPAMLAGDFEPGSPKIDYLVEQLTELAAEGHAALVFSQFLKALDLTGRALDAAGLPFLRLDGSTPSKQRKELVESFQSGDSPGIFLISMKTGGSGLNLTRASYVYHLDPWWNPAVENQASDRVHRIGQKRSVFVQRLLMRHTVEEKMMVLKQKKKELFDAVLDSSGAAAPDGAAALSASDFRFLIDP